MSSQSHRLSRFWHHSMKQICQTRLQTSQILERRHLGTYDHLERSDQSFPWAPSSVTALMRVCKVATYVWAVQTTRFLFFAVVVLTEKPEWSSWLATKNRKLPLIFWIKLGRALEIMSLATHVTLLIIELIKKQYQILENLKSGEKFVRLEWLVMDFLCVDEVM